MKRPLYKKLYLPLGDRKILGKENFKLQHQQIFFEDEQGGNIGFFPDGIHADSIQHMHTYKEIDENHYNDGIMRKAVERISPKMGDYSLWKNNCQDFIQRVLQEYYILLEQ